MKLSKCKVKGIIALIMSLIIFVSACMPAAALAITVPDSGTDEGGFCYSLEYSEGVFHLKINPEKLYAILEDGSVTKDELKSFLPSELVDAMESEEGVSAETLKSLIYKYVSIEDLEVMIADLPKDLIAKLIDLELIELLIDLEALTKIIPFDDIMASATHDAILELLDGEASEIILSKASSLHFENVIEMAEHYGGYGTIAEMFEASELKDIFNAIGIKRISNFITANDILSKIDYKSIISDIIDCIKESSPDVKGFISGFTDKIVSILLNDVEDISFNGQSFFAAPARQFDLATLIYYVIDAIPDMEDLLKLGTGDEIFSAVISLTLTDESTEPYNYGLVVSYEGDPTELNKLLAEYEEYFKLTPTLKKNDTVHADLDAIVPSVVASMYAKVLNNDIEQVDIGKSLREKLIRMPSQTLGDLETTLKELSEEERTKIYESISNQLDKIKEEAYAKLPESAQAAKNIVDNILAKVATKENFDKALDKFTAIVSKIAKGQDVSTSLVSLYEQGGGTFNFSISYSINIVEKLESISFIPEEAAVLFANNDLTAEFDASITVNGLHKVTITDADGSEFTTLVPEGTKFTVLEELLEVDIVDEDANDYDDDDKITGPSFPSTANRYFVRFNYSTRPALARTLSLRTTTEEVRQDVVFYNTGDTEVEEPDLESEEWSTKQPWNHYEWETDYKLNEERVVDVYYVETPNTYYLTVKVVDENNEPILNSNNEQITKIISFVFGDSDQTIANKLKNAVSGYTYVSHSGYVQNFFENDTGNQEITAVYKKSEDPGPGPGDEDITITFVDENGAQLDQQTFDKDVTDAALKAYAENSNKIAKMGYTIDIEREGNIVTVKYTPITVIIKWYMDEALTTPVNGGADDINWMFGNNYPTADDVLKAPKKDGYTFNGWSIDITDASNYTDPELYKNLDENGNAVLNVYAKWTEDTPIPPEDDRKATFVDEKGNALKDADGNVITLPYDENGIIGDMPEVPAKPGYKGEWETVNFAYATGEITIKPVYTKEIYTATFYADGIKVAEVKFDIDDVTAGKLPNVPEVPSKDGFLGHWKAYELKLEDIEITAVYTPYTTDDGGGDDDDDDSFWGSEKTKMYIGWIALILLALIVAGGIFGYFYMSPKNDSPDPEPDPEPEPEPTPEPDPEPEAEEIEVPTVENVTVEQADTMMSDNTAMRLVQTKVGHATAGPRAIVNVSTINAHFNAGDTVTLETLKEKKLVPAKTARIKILADGALEKPLNIEADAFSVQAVKMITLTGGTATQIVSED